jgi:hypothetical protein
MLGKISCAFTSFSLVLLVGASRPAGAQSFFDLERCRGQLDRQVFTVGFFCIPVDRDLLILVYSYGWGPRLADLLTAVEIGSEEDNRGSDHKLPSVSTGVRA